MTVVINKENFEEVSKQGVVLIDFWAEWCGPCQQMLPILDQFAEQMGDKMTVGKINVDENPELAGQFRVMSIPTLVVLKDGEMVDQMVGVQTIDKLEEACGKHL
jgi:thioredoxin 1